MLRRIIEENQTPTVLNLKNYNETLQAEAAEFDPRFHTELEELVHQGDLGKFDAFFSSKLQQKAGKLSEMLYSVIKILSTASLPMVERANEMISSSNELKSVKVENLNIYLNKLASRHSKKLAASTFLKMMRLQNSPVVLLSPGCLFEYLEECLQLTQGDVPSLLHLESQLIFAMDFLGQLSAMRQRDAGLLQSEYLRYLSSNVLSRILQRLVELGGLSPELKETVDAVLARYHKLLMRQFFAGLPEVVESDLVTPKTFIDYFVYFSAEVDHRSRTLLLDSNKLLKAVHTFNSLSDKMQETVIEAVAAVFQTGVSSHPLSVEYQFVAHFSELSALIEQLAPQKYTRNNFSQLLLAAAAKFSGKDPVSRKPTGNSTIDRFKFDSLVNGSLTEESQSHKALASEIKVWASAHGQHRQNSGKPSISPHANLALFEDVVLPTLSGKFEAANHAMNQQFFGPIVKDVMKSKVIAFYEHMFEVVHSGEFSTIRRMKNLHRVHVALGNLGTWREWSRLYDSSMTLNHRDKQVANAARLSKATDKLIFRSMIQQTDLLEFNHRLNKYIYKNKALPDTTSQETAPKQHGQAPREAETAKPATPPDQPGAAAEDSQSAKLAGKKSQPKNKSKKKLWEQKLPIVQLSIASLLPQRLSYRHFMENEQQDQHLLDFYLQHASPALFRQLHTPQNLEHLRLAHYLLEVAVRTQSPELLVHGEKLCGLLLAQLNPLQRERYLAFKASVAAHAGSSA